jgi:hypothetical protein
MLIKISFLMVVLAGLVLVGCDQRLQTSPADSQTCNTASCPISVTVDSCVVKTPDLDVRANPTTDITIQWTVTSGYTFSQDPLAFAIFLKSGNPHAVFRSATIAGNVLTVQFKKGGSGKHKHQYGLNVVAADGTSCATADPFVYE